MVKERIEERGRESLVHPDNSIAEPPNLVYVPPHRRNVVSPNLVYVPPNRKSTATPNILFVVPPNRRSNAAPNRLSVVPSNRKSPAALNRLSVVPPNRSSPAALNSEMARPEYEDTFTKEDQYYPEADPTPLFEANPTRDPTFDPQAAPFGTNEGVQHQETQFQQTDSTVGQQQFQSRPPPSQPAPRPQQYANPGYPNQSPTNYPPQASRQHFPPQSNYQYCSPQPGFPTQAVHNQPQNFPPQASPEIYVPQPHSPHNPGAAAPGFNQFGQSPMYASSGHGAPPNGVQMYVAPPPGFQAQQHPYPMPKKNEGWTTGLFDCMDDPTNALITACVPCFTFGQIAEIVDGGNTTCATSGILYGAIAFLVGLPCLISCGYRRAEISTLDGNKGFHGMGFMYLPSLLDQYPPSTHTLYPPPPPQLFTCVLPAGVQFFSSGYDFNDVSTYPRSYPIVLTEGDGSKIYVSCIAFRDPVSEDIAEAYRMPANSFADKCICLVSHSPSFGVLRDALEELFSLCFSPTGS
ncbi:hypothetical protein IFM89_026458, partial [Coptis chinensis]